MYKKHVLKLMNKAENVETELSIVSQDFGADSQNVYGCSDGLCMGNG